MQKIHLVLQGQRPDRFTDLAGAQCWAFAPFALDITLVVASVTGSISHTNPTT